MTAIKILLDPGHDCATYNQSPVVPKYYEGERMWKLYKYLRPALEKYGFIVGCTKTQVNQAISVTKRGAMARGYNFLLSLHSNACDDPSVDRPVGICFVDDDCGKIDDVSKELATVLSQTVADTMGTTKAQQYSRLSKNDRDHDGLKNDDYYGLLFGAHQAGVPAVILENSFHTNKEAAEWLLVDSNLKKLAQAIADALADYYGVTAPVAATKEGTTVKMQTLKPGSKHPHVKVMQMLLIGNGYDCGKSGADGSYGPATKKAVKAYQEDHKDTDGRPLTVDYICGPATWASLLKQ